MSRRKKHSFKRIRWILILLIIALPLIHFIRRAYKYVSLVREEQNLKKGILILRGESEVLLNRIQEYKRGTILETKARDDLGMIKPGEKVYLIKEE